MSPRELVDGQVAGETLTGSSGSIIVPTNRRVKTGDYNLEGLNPDQMLQTLALQLRNEVARALAAGKDAHLIAPRSAQNRSGVVNKAIEIELAAGGTALVLKALYKIKQRFADVVAPDPKTKAEKIVQRLQIGGKPRKDDHDLQQADVAALREAVAGNVALEHIVELMIQNRDVLQAKLEQDKKFPSLLSNAAFNKKLDAEPSMTGILIFADISDFWTVNDSLGQSFVDETLLRPLSEVLAGKLPGAARCRTLLCRQGGDEFMVFFEGMTDEKQAARLFAEVFVQTMSSIPYELLEEWYILLNEDRRIEIEKTAEPKKGKAAKLRQILATYADLKCKIGLQKRAVSMPGVHLEALAGNQMKRTQDYKALGFPTSSSTTLKDFIWDALTGKAARYVKTEAPSKKR